MDATGEDHGDRDSPAPFRRLVFYIPGYDPFPARRYREIYRREGAAQAAVSGYRLAIRPRAGSGYGWHVSAVIGRPAETEIEVLVWSDLVKGSMQPGVAGTYALLVRTAWLYLASGALRRLVGLRKGPMIAALYPAVALILQALLALGLAWGMLRLAAPLPWGLGWGLAALVAVGVLEGFRQLDRYLLVYYLMQDYGYATAERGAWPPDLAARLDHFRARLHGAMLSGVDEVLLVGHSSGVQLGVTVLADLIRQGLPPGAPALGFLSLGQAVPMVSFLPRATRLRGDLAFLSAASQVTWVDVSAPGDGCSYALCDPVAVTGVAPPDRRWPLVLSAAFSQTLRPETWKALKRRYFRLHFQYIHAFDRPGDYDYFAITAGPVTLADRFRGRAASASRITRACSPYRDIA